MTGQEIPQANFAGGGRVKPEAGLASILQSRGRGGDTMLVHMAPSEVKGLQALALAHGGSLSINPDTGLVEAGFLKSLLPTLIGAVLTPLTGGLINPFTAGLLVGGVEAARTGDLGKGLMAGLGAYGGAGLSTALAGTGAAAGAATSEAVTKAGAEAAAAAAAKEGATQAAIDAAKQAAMKEAAQKAVQDKLATGAGRGLFGRLPEGVASFKNIGAGAGEIFKTGGAGLGGIGGMGAAGTTFGTLSMPAKAGLVSAGANALTPEFKIPEGTTDIDQSYYESYGYDPEAGTFRGGQWRTGYPGFPGGMAGGGPVSFAEGGATTQKTWEEMPLSPDLAQPNSAKAGWLEALQKNPELQKPYLDAGYPPEFFQQNPQTFTGARPFIAGKDEATRASEQARLAQAGFSPTYMQQFQAPSAGIASGAAFSDYLQNLNKFVTSPVAPPPKAPAPPPAAVVPPGAGGRPIAGGSPFTGFNGINFSAIQDMINGGGATSGRDMRWDPNAGQFVSTYQPPVYNEPTTYPSDTFDYGGFDFSNIQGPPASDVNPYMNAAGFNMMPQVPAEPVYTPPAYTPPEPPRFVQEPIYQEPVFTPPAYREPEPAPFFQQPVFDYTPAPSYTPPEPQYPVQEFLGTPYMPEPTFDYVPAKYYEDLNIPSIPRIPAMTPDDRVGISPIERERYDVVEEPSYTEPFDYNFYSGMDFGDSRPFAAGGSVEYAAAGKLLRGPGDGMSDDIKANISGKQEARLADGEFVIPADVVSHLGNGSSEAGSRKLYKMMANIRKARTGKTKQAPAVKVDKYLPKA